VLGLGARTFWAKIMRRLPFHGPGGPPKLRNVDCGMRIEKEKPKNPKSAIRNPKLKGPMLFAQKLLAPGPQPKHPGNVNPPQADPRQSRGVTLRELAVQPPDGKIEPGSERDPEKVGNEQKAGRPGHHKETADGENDGDTQDENSNQAGQGRPQPEE
jgi:hypothetical protein